MDFKEDKSDSFFLGLHRIEVVHKISHPALDPSY